MGEKLPFDHDLKFTTNLKLYSNFVALTSQLFMSCIEGNHRMYTALNILEIIKRKLPIQLEDEDPPQEISEDTCIMKPQSVEVVTLLPHSIQDQIEEGKTIAKKFIGDKQTLIVDDWCDWFVKIVDEWNPEDKHFEPHDLYKANHHTQTPLKYLIDGYKYMWEHLVKNFDWFPIKEQISATPEKLEQLKNLRGHEAPENTNVCIQSLPKTVRNPTKKMSYFVESTI